MKRCILTVLLALTCSNPAYAQQEDAGGWETTRKLDPQRTVSVFMHFGYAEIIGVGVLAQLSDRYALGVIVSEF